MADARMPSPFKEKATPDGTIRPRPFRDVTPKEKEKTPDRGAICCIFFVEERKT